MYPLENLMTEDESHLSRYSEQWLRVLTSTAPAPRARVEEAITALYDLLRQPTPEILWVESPSAPEWERILAGVCPQGFVEKHSLAPSINTMVLDLPKIAQSIYATRILRRIEDAGHPALLESVRWAVVQAMRREFPKFPWHRHGREMTPPDFSGLGYWLLLYKVLGIQPPAAEIAALEALEKVAIGSTAIWPLQGTCIICERPAVLIHSEPPAPVLHCGSEPALTFRDGFALWAWRGQIVPRLAKQ